MRSVSSTDPKQKEAGNIERKASIKTSPPFFVGGGHASCLHPASQLSSFQLSP